ncbi:Csu type fimbrial protein [Novosphingobium pokkalii]|uniref:Spore coat U domain-containing protein n=1 Tax=Novosphingobium pokkalii TaxID=1770194 RepID=A0ABV7UZR4_9SPHN|nr:spore coat protein U domain-containing protein [Novosphingobium pokkalii]
MQFTMPLAAAVLFTSPAHAANYQDTCSFSNTSSTYTFSPAEIGTSVTAGINANLTCSGSYNVLMATCVQLNYSGNYAYNIADGSKTFPVNVILAIAPPSMTSTVVNPGSGTKYSKYVGTGPGVNFTTSANNYVQVNVPATSTSAGMVPGTYRVQYSYAFAYGETFSGNGCTGSGFTLSSRTLTFDFVINAVCSIASVQNIAFGNVSYSASAQNASGSVVVNCPTSAPYTIYLSDGNNRQSAGSGLRRMKSAAGNLLPYQLYKDASRTQVWDATGGPGVVGGSGGVGGTGTSSNVSSTVYASIPAGTAMPPVGSYSDNVVVTVAY